MNHGQLTHCTLTGVDEKTDLRLVSALSGKFPIVEWGFLYSPKRQGSPGRYPSVYFLRNAFKELPVHVKVALHICGDGVTQLIHAEAVVSELVQLVGQRGGRVQLNFNARTTQEKFTLAEVHACIARHPDVRFITQNNGANANVWLDLMDLPNHAILFDASGGKGLSADQWVAPLDGVNCGYAGGLGPINVAEELKKIQSVVGDASFWIDMEGKLRNADDWFDLTAAKSVLESVIGVISPVSKGFFERHHDGRVRVVFHGSIVDADAGWNREQELFTATDLKAAMEEVHKVMGLSLWTIYENPTDRPGEFVARRWHASSVRHDATEDIFVGATLESVRSQLPQGLSNIGRKRGDEHQIVEVWV
jgi:hypothetical protein